MALVKLEVSVEGTGKTLQVPCYVMSSSKPLWRGGLWNCGLVLGANCLEKFGFAIAYPNGQMVRLAVKVNVLQNINVTETAPNAVVCTPVHSSTDVGVSSLTIRSVCGSTSKDVSASFTPNNGVCVSTFPSTDPSKTVVLDRHLQIGPFQTKVVPVNVVGVSASDLHTI